MSMKKTGETPKKRKPKQRKWLIKDDGQHEVNDEAELGPLSTISLLLQDMDDITPLTPEETTALGEAVQAGILAADQLKEYEAELSEKDKEPLLELIRAGEAASKSLVEHNMPLVFYFAKSFIGKGLPYADLLQEGFLSMTKASKSYDPKKGKFSTYVGKWIKCDLNKAVNVENCGAITLPNHIMLAHGKIQGAKRRAEIIQGQEMSTGQAAKRAGIDKRLADHAEALWEASRTISADVPVYEENPRPSAQNATVGETIALDESSIETVTTGIENATLRRLMQDCLSPIEEVCTNLYFGMEDEVQRTLTSIAAEVGITKAGIHEIIQRSLKKLQAANARCDLLAFLRP